MKMPTEIRVNYYRVLNFVGCVGLSVTWVEWVRGWRGFIKFWRKFKISHGATFWHGSMDQNVHLQT